MSKEGTFSGAGRTIPMSLPGMDTEAALERLRGNWKLFRKITAQFQRDYGTAAAEMEEALERGDAQAAERLAHTVKGIAGNLSAMELHVVAGELETATRLGKTDGLDDLAARFRNALETVLASAGMLQEGTVPDEQRGGGASGSGSGSSCEGEGTDSSKVASLLIELDHLMREGNFLAEECFNALKKHLRGSRFRRDLEQLQCSINVFDLDGGRTALNRIARSLNITLGDGPEEAR